MRAQQNGGRPQHLGAAEDHATAAVSFLPSRHTAHNTTLAAAPLAALFGAASYRLTGKKRRTNSPKRRGGHLSRPRFFSPRCFNVEAESVGVQARRSGENPTDSLGLRPSAAPLAREAPAPPTPGSSSPRAAAGFLLLRARRPPPPPKRSVAFAAEAPRHRLRIPSGGRISRLVAPPLRQKRCSTLFPIDWIVCTSIASALWKMIVLHEVK